jgi:hypothetical protein
MNAIEIVEPVKSSAEPVCVPTPPVGVTPVRAKIGLLLLDEGINEELVTSFGNWDTGVVELPLRLPFR